MCHPLTPHLSLACLLHIPPATDIAYTEFGETIKLLWGRCARLDDRNACDNIDDYKVRGAGACFHWGPARGSSLTLACALLLAAGPRCCWPQYYTSTYTDVFIKDVVKEVFHVSMGPTTAAAAVACTP